MKPRLSPVPLTPEDVQIFRWLSARWPDSLGVRGKEVLLRRLFRADRRTAALVHAWNHVLHGRREEVGRCPTCRWVALTPANDEDGENITPAHGEDS
jgi:hypothetical protein